MNEKIELEKEMDENEISKFYFLEKNRKDELGKEEIAYKRYRDLFKDKDRYSFLKHKG